MYTISFLIFMCLAMIIYYPMVIVHKSTITTPTIAFFWLCEYMMWLAAITVETSYVEDLTLFIMLVLFCVSGIYTVKYKKNTEGLYMLFSPIVAACYSPILSSWEISNLLATWITCFAAGFLLWKIALSHNEVNLYSCMRNSDYR